MSLNKNHKDAGIQEPEMYSTTQLEIWSQGENNLNGVQTIVCNPPECLLCPIAVLL